jgi:hypothetical protein
VYNNTNRSFCSAKRERNLIKKEHEMEERYLLGTPLFIEVGRRGKILMLNDVGSGKANLVTVTPKGEVPFQGGELPLVKDGTVGEEDIEQYILSYLEKISDKEAPRITIRQGYFLETEGQGIYTTEKPL